MRSNVYNAWVNMRQRCNNPKHPEYSRYGALGISVSTEWDCFETFKEDMGEPEIGYSLDRIDPRGNYSKENCRWADNVTQSFNTKIKITNKSGKSGVKLYKSGRWRAFIGFKGKQYHLGYFDCIEDAIDARKSAELKFYGFIKE